MKTEMAKRRRSRRIRLADRKITAWLRSCISSIDFGIKTKGPKPHPVHVNLKGTIIKAYNTGSWRLLKRLSNRDLGKHITGQDTFYFAGNGRFLDPYTLVLIDIDCHKVGSFQGAVAFVEYLRKHHYPNLFWEASTNGNGVHAYVVIEKRGYVDVTVNEALDRLQAFLRKVLASTSFDVETVEIKGHCPVIGWAEKRGEIKRVQMGQLGKIPRDLVLEAEQLKRTTVLSCFDLLKLPMPEKTQPTGNGKGKRPPASISGCFLTEDEVAKTHTSYLKLAHLLLDHHRLGTSSKAAVEPMDISIFLMFIVFFTNNMNEDGSLPWARFKKFWDAVYESGDIARPFQCNRFAAIRNYFTSLSLIDWEDDSYKVGRLGSDGKRYGGKACKWKANQLLLALIKKVEASETVIPEAVSDSEEGERASFTTTNIIGEIKNLARMTYSQIKRPRQIYDPPPSILLPEDIGRYLTPFEKIQTVAI